MDLGTIQAIFRQACRFIPEDQLRVEFLLIRDRDLAEVSIYVGIVRSLPLRLGGAIWVGIVVAAAAIFAAYYVLMGIVWGVLGEAVMRGAVNPLDPTTLSVVVLYLSVVGGAIFALVTAVYAFKHTERW